MADAAKLERYRPQQEPERDPIAARRKKLRAAGYSPIPVNGKSPQPMQGWQSKIDTNDEEIDLWSKLYPHHKNDGLLTRYTPALDIDILNGEAAEAVEDLVRKRFEEHNRVIIRIGRAPKRAIPFRTVEPFKKITINLMPPNGGAAEKLEFLADGQQLVAFGIHPDTGKPYSWSRGEPGEVKQRELPYIDEAGARQLMEDAATLLCRDYGYQRVGGGSRKDKGDDSGDKAEWGFLYENIRTGRDLHDSLVSLAANLMTSGMGAGTVINQLRQLMENIPEAERDTRWQSRYKDIPRIVDGFEKKQEAPKEPSPQYPQQTLEQVHGVFSKWFGPEYDLGVIDAVLATAASERLSGDPLWTLVISGPGNAKTETVQALSGAGAHVTSTIASEGALLSATRRTNKSTGGLLRRIGERGLLVIKDITSILSADRNTRGSVLAAIREIYDGRWERNVGTDGGQTLTWTGRIVIVGAVTTAWDTAHAVVTAMGDRFVVIRADSSVGRVASGERAIANTGDEVTMRQELAAAVGGIIGHINGSDEGYKLNETETKRLVKVADVVTYARTAVERDYQGEVVDAHAPEMPTRFVKQLAQMVR